MLWFTYIHHCIMLQFEHGYNCPHIYSRNRMPLTRTHTPTPSERVNNFCFVLSLYLSFYSFWQRIHMTHNIHWAEPIYFRDQVRMLRTSMEFLFGACWLIYEWLQSLALLPSRCLWRKIASIHFVSFHFICITLFDVISAADAAAEAAWMWTLRISISNRFRSFQISFSLFIPLIQARTC